MSEYETVRHLLPLLSTGQSHKEIFHNEALQRLDFLIDPVASGQISDPSNLAPSVGESWLVGATASGAWEGKEDNIACWTENGWIFVNPIETSKTLITDQGSFAIFRNNIWQRAESIQPPDGGAIIDEEARSAIDSILTALQMHGILPNQA